jgi:hypothetical protein
VNTEVAIELDLRYLCMALEITAHIVDHESVLPLFSLFSVLVPPLQNSLISRRCEKDIGHPFVGDGIYDREPVYEAVQHHSSGTLMVVPPRKDAVLSNRSDGPLSQRNQHIAEIESVGRANWRRSSGYYLQSHVENTFCRFKRIIGGRLRSKHDEAQKREALLGCSILNRMLGMGRPVSYQVC